jgi:EmrB/QacA subfamily drug resistance transporter
MNGWRHLLVEAARPAAIARRPNAHWFVVGTVCVGAFMGQLDASIVTLALPTLQRDFGASLAAVEWVGLAYLLALVASVVAIGSLADMVGRKQLYIYGFALFTVASGLCAASPTLSVLVALRVLQGIGAAMLQANSVALIVAAMPPGALGRGIGVQGAAQAVGLAMGPAVGGWLVGLGGWQLVFLVNVPVGVVAIVLAWFLLPRSRDLAPRVPFDWHGLTLFAPSVCAVLLAASFGVVWPMLPAVLLLLLFAWRERRTSHPLIHFSLFRRPTFSAGIASGLLAYLVTFGVLFVVPFYLERSLGLTPGRAGAVLSALPIALGLTAPLAGRLADRLDIRWFTTGGMVLAACSLLAVSQLAASRWHTPMWALVMCLLFLGVALGTFTPANNASVMGAAPRQRAGMAGGVLNMTRGLGTAFGVTLTGAVFGAAAGSSAVQSPSATRDGFTSACVALAVVAAIAALASLLRGSDGA